jgi:hypothetical protein
MSSEDLIKKANSALKKYESFEKDTPYNMPDEYYIHNAPKEYLLTMKDVRKIANKKLKELIVIEPQHYSSANLLNSESEEIEKNYFYGDDDYNNSNSNEAIAVTGGGSDVWIVVSPAFLKWLSALNRKLSKLVKAGVFPTKKKYVNYNKVKTVEPTLKKDISLADLKKEVKANLKIYTKAFDAMLKSEAAIPEKFCISSISDSYALKITDVKKIISGKVREFIVIEPSDYDCISVLNKCSEVIINDQFKITDKGIATTYNNNKWILVTPKMLLWLEKLIVKIEKWIVDA